MGRGRLCVLLAVATAATAAPAHAASLYDGPGPKPGPPILYEPPASSPQLENTGVWKAAPILVSGASAYRDGEFLYQDYLYDDHGARQIADPGDPRGGNDTFSRPNGTYTYPTDPAYANNAADLVELRVKPLPDATAFRITLNTMNDPALVGGTIAIGDSATPLPLPYGANATAPAQFFLTWHGSTADLRDAATQGVVATPTVAVDQARRQVQITVPHSAWNPGTGKVKLAAGVGLWDTANNRFLIPQASASATQPGGAGIAAAPEAFFNVAFRPNEPFPDVTDTAGIFTNAAWWRDKKQGNELATGNLGAFRAEVDFAKLASGDTDDAGVPTTGAMDRILVSHFETKQGIDWSTLCGKADSCAGELRGRLLPYAIYVPKKKGPNGYGLTLLLHSLGANYNQFLGTRNQSQFGDRGSGSIVITPSGRGPDGWYYDYAGADTFEVWADVARRFQLDPDYSAIAGYSMGGYGTYKFATQFPDLFAKAQPTVGPPGLGIAPADPAQPTGGPQTSTFPMLASLRNIPFLIWDGVEDELVPFAGVQAQANGFDDLGYRYEFDAFATADHLLLAAVDQYQPAADFLGDAKVDRNPAHVTYVRNPTMDFPKVGTTADHAYWLSDIELGDSSGSAPNGTIDVRSEGFGVGDPAPSSTGRATGTLTGGNVFPSLAYTRQYKTWGATPKTAKHNRLDIDAHNVKSVTIDPKRARVSCSPQLVVTSDTPLVVKLAGCKNGREVFADSAACNGLPRTSITRSDAKASRKKGVSAGGRAVGFRCKGGKRKAGVIRRVQISVALQAKGKDKCRFLQRNGRFTKARSCVLNVWQSAKLGRRRGGKVPWTFRSRHRLPAGAYQLHVRSIDATGGVGKLARKTVRAR